MYANIGVFQWISIILASILAITAIANIINARSVSISVKLSSRSGTGGRLLNVVINNAGPAPAKGIFWVLMGISDKSGSETIRYGLLPIIGPKDEVTVESRILKKGVKFLDASISETEFINAEKFDTLVVCCKILRGKWNPQRVERSKIKYHYFGFSPDGQLTNLGTQRVKVKHPREETYDLKREGY